MSQSQDTDLRNHLLRQDAAQVQKWLRSVCTGEVKAPKEYNWWVGLAEGAAFNARKAESPDLKWALLATSIYDRLAAFIDIKTYKLLSDATRDGNEGKELIPTNTNPTGKLISVADEINWGDVSGDATLPSQRGRVTNSVSESDMHSSMKLRAYMILRLGSVPGNPVLDMERIICWFFDLLNMSLEEATRKAASWQEGLKTGNPFKELTWDDVRALRYIKSRLSVIKELSKSNEFKPTEELSAWLALWKELP